MSWDEEAKTWDDNPAVRAYAAAAFASLGATLQERGVSLDGARVLDFGCGTGLLAEALAPSCREVVALDISGPMVAVLRAKRLERVRALVGELDGLVKEALEGPFELIVASSSLAFVPDYSATVATLAGLLAPGGLLVQWDWELQPEAEEPMGLSREQIASALEGAGLVEVQVDVGFREPFGEMVMAPLRGVGRRP